MIDIVVETKLIANYIKNLRKYFHMHAELSMQEYETNKKIKEPTLVTSANAFCPRKFPTISASTVL